MVNRKRAAQPVFLESISSSDDTDVEDELRTSNRVNIGNNEYELSENDDEVQLENESDDNKDEDGYMAFNTQASSKILTNEAFN